jgi:CRISPR-associated endoribonuclease Cas6
MSSDATPVRKTASPQTVPVVYRPEAASYRTPGLNTFEFYRFRFHLQTTESIHFPPGKSANLFRGWLGRWLCGQAEPLLYRRLFEPGKSLCNAPSGFADWPRPFLFRASHLDDLTITSGHEFYFDLHLFDTGLLAFHTFRGAFANLSTPGIGAHRGRAILVRVDQLDLDSQATPVEDLPGPPSTLEFEDCPKPISRVRLHFETPTELKWRGMVSDRPEFGILFARLRDRVSTLRRLYGKGPMEIDFAALGARAGAIQLSHCDLRWEQVERRSGRSGQLHPLGGFTGVADYEGPLGEFMPWLYAARWVGVGRQTVWGKGDVRVFLK